MLKAADLLVLDLFDQLVEFRAREEDLTPMVDVPVPVVDGDSAHEPAALFVDLRKQVLTLEKHLAEAREVLCGPFRMSTSPATPSRTCGRRSWCSRPIARHGGHRPRGPGGAGWHGDGGRGPNSRERACARPT